jgi:hypothetical protein
VFLEVLQNKIPRVPGVFFIAEMIDQFTKSLLARIKVSKLNWKVIIKPPHVVDFCHAFVAFAIFRSLYTILDT